MPQHREEIRRARLTPARRTVAVLEVVLATVLVVADLFLPAVLLCLLAAASLVVRRQRFATLGLVRPTETGLVPTVLGLVLLWTTVDLALVVPTLGHLTGSEQEVGVFAELEGDLTLLVGLLAASWTLAAVVEEVAFRGYVFTRIREGLGASRAGTVVGAVGSAILFAAIHTEQGPVGVGVSFVDGLFFAWLRVRFRTVWAAVLAHGSVNTLGVVGYYLFGPIPAWW